MPGTFEHIAIADKVYCILGDTKIKNIPLFFGGNIAPDAIHAKTNYERADKKRSHLCEGIRSYGYGYPEMGKLFKDRINDFINNYYLTASNDKDLYLGYVVHLLADEFYLLSIYEQLENHLKNSGANPDEPQFRKNLADDVNNSVYSEFFRNAASLSETAAHEYRFAQNAKAVLESVWDYEVKDYIGINEINASKQWVIDKYFKNQPAIDNVSNTSPKMVNLAAEDIISQLSGKGDIIKIL